MWIRVLSMDHMGQCVLRFKGLKYNVNKTAEETVVHDVSSVHWKVMCYCIITTLLPFDYLYECIYNCYEEAWLTDIRQLQRQKCVQHL